MDESGVIVFWSIIHRQCTPETLSSDQGLAPWAGVSLVQGLVASLQDLNPNFTELHCFDLQLSNEDSNHLFISSNYGVLHCLASGMKPKPKYYGSSGKYNVIPINKNDIKHWYYCLQIVQQRIV